MATSDWVDVDGILQQASDSLSVGQLLSVENFNLYEAMSAVEIGNPKMDASMTQSEDVEQLLQQGLAPTEISSAQLLSIIDQLMMLEATWHSGSSLAQTLFSCLYMLRPERADSNVYLKAYCLMLKAVSSEVRSLMYTGCVCEDEDFNPNAFGLPLDDSGAGPMSEKVAATFDQAVQHLQHITTATAKTAAQVPQVAKDGEEAVDPEHAPALLSRLMFRQHFFNGVLSIQRYTAEYLQESSNHFHSALAELANIRNTFAATGAPEFGFHSNVNRHLMGPAPPRQCKVLTQEATMKYFETLLTHLTQACTISTISDYRSLQVFLEDFSREQPSIISRSLLHMQLNHQTRDSNAPSYPWSPDQAMMCSCMNLPNKPELPADLAMFLEQCLIAVGNYCQAMLLNRARLRRRLRSSLIDWHNLWTHATNAEVCPEVQALLKERGWNWQPVDANGDEVLGPLALWVEREACYNMLLYLLLGMELQLYQPYEFVQIYWYCNYLLTCMITHMKVLQQWQTAPSPPASPSPAPAKTKGTATGKKGAAARKARKPQPEPPAPKPAVPLTADVIMHTREVLVTEMHRFMSEGMMRLMLGLQQVGAVTAGPNQYNTEEERFDLRFGSFFQLLKPDPLPYEYFKSSADCSRTTPDALLVGASECFGHARRTAQILASSSLGLTPMQAAQVKAMDRVAMHNLLAGVVVRQALGQQSVLTTTFNFTHHPFFPAVVVKRK